MVYRVLRTASTVCVAFLSISFLLFAINQVSHASNHQAAEVAPATPATPLVPLAVPRKAAPTPHKHQMGQPRRFIDGVSHKLTSPFDSIIESNDSWVKRGVPTILALLVFGGGLGFLARFARARV